MLETIDVLLRLLHNLREAPLGEVLGPADGHAQELDAAVGTDLVGDGRREAGRAPPQANQPSLLAGNQ